MQHLRTPDGRASTDSVQKPGALKMAMCAPAAVAGEAKLSRAASCSEYGRRELDKLRQFPQVLGSGGE
jgi:hypothetical protein